MFKQILLTGFMALTTLCAFAQTDAEKASAEEREALKYMDAGNYEKAAAYYKNALKLNPGDLKYQYGLALAFYRAENYPKAIEFAEKTLQNNPDLDCYRLLGNSYDLNNEYEKGMAVLQKAFERFPGNGALYLDMGVIELIRNHPQTAIDHWEKGIKSDPSFADNYFLAAQTYAGSDRKVWALLYGEVFMNLERGTARWDTMSHLLYNLYNGLLTDSAYLQKGTLELPRTKTNGFEQAHLRVFDILRKNGMMNPDRAKKADGATNTLKLIGMVRKNFMEMWLQTFTLLYSNNLYANLRQMMDKGYLDSYNNWMFSPVCTNDFLEWKAGNEAKYADFINWFLENPLKVDVESYFVRQQYEK
ncbi:tetratricopeptide repeat protein [Sphingobacteriales bacterium UPWRP_1]|nr:hypothetical protein B6N25_04830 [Sphingobacteriales bacterium TSM_CSS]PSJ78285.1 tetratricopeptide repeat protein [Sphingobacteriales bacterium UPWRP_1]